MALSKLAVRRLTKLADFMHNLPKKDRKHFDMGWWIQPGVGFGIKSGRIVKSKDIRTCGTQACALGWAATIPDFQKAGLSMNKSARIFLKGQDLGTTIAATTIFDIDVKGFSHLFLDAEVNTPKQWAKYCRAFIKANS